MLENQKGFFSEPPNLPSYQPGNRAEHKSEKAGCGPPEHAEQTAVKGGGHNLGVKTWCPGAVKLGYTKLSTGGVTNVAKVGLNTGGHAGGKQSVKGKMGKKAPGEAKPAAGQRS